MNRFINSLLVGGLVMFGVVGCGEGSSQNSPVIPEYDTPIRGSIDIQGAQYNGVITKAQIDSTNDTEFGDKALHVRDTESVLRSDDYQDVKQHAIELIINAKNALSTPKLRYSNTIEGSCGGSSNISFAEDFAKVILDDYCESGVKISGVIDVTFDTQKYFSMTFNTLIDDIKSDDSLLLKDFVLDVTMLHEYDYSDFEMDMSGLMYHSRYGGVIVSTPETLSFYNSQVYDGEILIEGRNSSYTSLIFESSISYIESDYDGDGSVDYVSR
jgi:hypothetical protein